MTSFLPPASADLVRAIAEAVRDAGGRALLVGGTPRDFLLGRPPRGGDVDIEVYGVEPTRLPGLLAPLGRVADVGKAFGVLKVARPEVTADVSLPRRESKVARGHKGFAVRADPDLSFAEACARRDLTVNAILLDPLTGEWIDPFAGRDDLCRRRLRHVSDAFAEDPLRVLRVVQFAASLEFTIAPETAALCRTLDLTELPKERVFDEVAKWLLRARRPSLGLDALVATGALSLFPELAALRGVPQDVEWHPEGDVWLHTGLALDAAARTRHCAKRPLAFMLAVLCHDLGKATTTRFLDGRLRARGHDIDGDAATRSFLERLTDERALVEEVAALARAHLRPMQLARDGEQVTDAAIRRLARDADLEMLVLVADADAGGRVLPDEEARGASWVLERAARLGVADGGPKPLLLGRHLVELGMTPGPAMGALLKEIFELQLDGAITSLEQAREEARRRLRGRGNAPP